MIAGALAACGSGSGTRSSGKAISKAQFIQRADAICSTGNRRISALPSPKFDPATATKQQLPQIARYLPHLISELQLEHDAILALPSPASDQTVITKALSFLQKYIGLLTSERSAAAAGNLAAFEALFAQEGQASSPVAQANTLAKQFGLKVCGKG
jgi:hypothetical protein